MFRSYLKIALRNLRKNRLSSIINIAGLGAGMGVAMLIGLWIYDEVSFNKYHQNYDRIAQVLRHQDDQTDRITSGYHPLPLGLELRTAYGNYFKYVVVSRQTEEHIISADGVDNQFVQQGRYMQPEAPDMLGLKMLYGSRAGLRYPNSILLSGTLAKKIFGEADPTGKIVKLDNVAALKVTGVYEDLPDNSDFRYLSFIAPFDLYLSFLTDKNVLTEWDNYDVFIYTQLQPGVDADKASGAIKGLYLKHVDNRTAQTKPELFLHPMSKWHLHSKFENGVPATSDQMRYLWFFGLIGVFVLLLACINFMNLSTARSGKRAKEVGIRKAVGSLRQQLLTQFFFESILIALFSFILSIVLVVLALPWFNKIAGKDISILWANPWFWLIGLIFTLLTGMLAGSYPAIYLSSFNPVSVLKGSFQAGPTGAIPRKILVVLQFTVSIMLCVSTIIVYRQIQFTKDRPVGYSRDGLLEFHLLGGDGYGKYPLFHDELMKTGVVEGTAAAGGPVTEVWSMNKGFIWKGKDPSSDPSFNTLSVSQDYGKTIGWQFVAGGGFNGYATDSAGFVINESAAKLMGLKNPVGEYVNWEPVWRQGGNFKILGVIRDMVMESPFEPANPTIFMWDPGVNWLFVKIKPNTSASGAIEKIEPVFRSLLPSAPFEYKFADQEYDKKFVSEVRIGKLASVFAGLAIFISCLGLFGLASFVAEQRTKEIGIRKVLGASIITIWGLISREFIILVLISLVIAAPADYFLMHGWLQNYRYRSGIPLWIFLVAGIGALLIALLTVSFQILKAALINPAKSLKSD